MKFVLVNYLPFQQQEVIATIGFCLSLSVCEQLPGHMQFFTNHHQTLSQCLHKLRIETLNIWISRSKVA